MKKEKKFCRCCGHDVRAAHSGALVCGKCQRAGHTGRAGCAQCRVEREEQAQRRNEMIAAQIVPFDRMPSLEDVIYRIRFADSRYRKACRELYGRVASGKRHPNEPPLPDNVVRVAAQVMVILYEAAGVDA